MTRILYTINVVSLGDRYNLSEPDRQTLLSLNIFPVMPVIGNLNKPISEKIIKTKGEHFIILLSSHRTFVFASVLFNVLMRGSRKS